MNESKTSFNVLASIEKHIEALKPLLPRQAIVGVGEYPIKTLLKEPALSREGTVPIFIEKSSDDIYKWIPKAYNAYFALGFEDEKIDTHFWYDVLPTLAKNTSIMDSLKQKNPERLRGAIIFSSVWDGVGSAALPSLTSKFRKQNIDSLSIAVLPSKIQPADAHFNAYAALQMCLATEGSTVLLLSRDELETFEGVDRKGVQIKGNTVVNYLLDLFLAKESLVGEISELSRTFNVKLFSAVTVTAASYRVYGSLENMLNTASLKPLLAFDLSSAKLLYVLLRMPANLKDKIPRAQIELQITNWFKERTNPQSIHISEPIYTKDMSDRIDIVLFIGGFDTSQMFADWDKKVSKLTSKAVEKGHMTEDWQVLIKIDEPPKPPEPAAPPIPMETVPPETAEIEQPVEEQKIAASPVAEATAVLTNAEAPVEANSVDLPQPAAVEEPTEAAKPQKNRSSRRNKKATEKETPQPQADPQTPTNARRTRKARTQGKAE
jgi:hypothetical protein